MHALNELYVATTSCTLICHTYKYNTSASNDASMSFKFFKLTGNPKKARDLILSVFFSFLH